MVLTEMPSGQQGAPQHREVLRPRRADVGLPVGQQDDAVEAPRLLEVVAPRRHLAARRRGWPSSRARNLPDEVDETCGVGDGLRRHQHVDDVVEDDDGGDVGRGSRLIAMIAASRAWAMRSPCMEPERSMTNATLTGVRVCEGSGLQPCRETRR